MPMRVLALLCVLSACASPAPGKLLANNACEERARQCSLTAGSAEYCAEEREVCLEERNARQERQDEKERGYDDYRKDRERAGNSPL